MDFNLLKAQDIFFTTFHTLLILFNLFGWLHSATKKLNFISLSLTVFSWFVLGIWKGWGYCFLTDYHWKILMKLGYQDLPNSYIAFLVERITGYLPDSKIANIMAVVGLLFGLSGSIYSNFLKKKN